MQKEIEQYIKKEIAPKFPVIVKKAVVKDMSPVPNKRKKSATSKMRTLISLPQHYPIVKQKNNFYKFISFV
jgi:hypothetical protein